MSVTGESVLILELCVRPAVDADRVAVQQGQLLLQLLYLRIFRVPLHLQLQPGLALIIEQGLHFRELLLEASHHLVVLLTLL